MSTLPPDPFPFPTEGPEAGNRGRLLFTQLVESLSEPLGRNEFDTATQSLRNGIGALSEDDLRAVVYFAVGMESARQLGLLPDDQ